MVPDARRSVPFSLMAGTAQARIRSRILDWFVHEQRDLPWRHTREPWAVLVSEMMLQQTQASRISQRFPPFMARFPTPRAMADASEAEVLAAWAGLGYNRRALLLQRAARVVTAGGWPTEVKELRGLPGVGAYTARAVAAIAFGRPVGAVDTNVRRWLTRRFALPDSAPPAALQDLADALAAAGGPRTSELEAASWMHASMEFGARVCTVRRPRCAACPIARGCPARRAPASVPVASQPAFAGSLRAARGRLVRALVAAPGNSLPAAALAELTSQAEPALDGLERDGLAHRSGAMVRLGPPSTIEP